MKLICLIIIIGHPFLHLGSGIQKYISKDKDTNERKDAIDNYSGLIASAIMFIITQVIFYYAGIYDMIENEL